MQTGDILIATSDDAASWQTIPQPTVPTCLAYNSANQTITTTTETLLTWDSETIDTDNMHSTSSNTSRITTNTAGKYLFSFRVSFAGNATGRRYAYIRKNGSTALLGSICEIPASANNRLTLFLSILVDCATTDYFEVLTYQNSGVNVDIDGGNNQVTCFFQANKVSS